MYYVYTSVLLNCTINEQTVEFLQNKSNINASIQVLYLFISSTELFLQDFQKYQMSDISLLRKDRAQYLEFIMTEQREKDL